jgi:hypothetical protein
VRGYTRRALDGTRERAIVKIRLFDLFPNFLVSHFGQKVDVILNDPDLSTFLSVANNREARLIYLGSLR